MYLITYFKIIHIKSQNFMTLQKHKVMNGEWCLWNSNLTLLTVLREVQHVFYLQHLKMTGLPIRCASLDKNCSSQFHSPVKWGLSNNRRKSLQTGRCPLQNASPSLLHEEMRISYIWKMTDIWSHWILFCSSLEDLGKKITFNSVSQESFRI